MIYIGISGKGQRTYNEDAFYPQPNLDNVVPNLFMVCDGVGGSAKGEVASGMVCNKVAEYFAHMGKIDYPNFSEAIKFAEDAMCQHIMKYPDAEGMATTLAGLFLYNGNACIAHVGDSRVYWIRNGVILHQTIDHSLVQELVVSGYITAEEAKTHPKRNIITRAISGNIKPALVTEINIQDIEEGDFFFLCSDGILESIDDAYIAESFKADRPLGEIINEIKSACEVLSSDNFTCVLVQIEAQDCMQLPEDHQTQIEIASISQPKGKNHFSPAIKEKVKADVDKTIRPSSYFKMGALLTTVMVVGLGIILWWPKVVQNTKNPLISFIDSATQESRISQSDTVSLVHQSNVVSNKNTKIIQPIQPVSSRRIRRNNSPSVHDSMATMQSVGDKLTKDSSKAVKQNIVDSLFIQNL